MSAEVGLKQIDMDRVRRLTTNLAELLASVLKAMDGVSEQSKPLRVRISADLNELMKTLLLRIEDFYGARS